MWGHFDVAPSEQPNPTQMLCGFIGTLCHKKYKSSCHEMKETCFLKNKNSNAVSLIPRTS